ncbi:transposase [Aquirufa sp. ROCK2-A2]
MKKTSFRVQLIFSEELRKEVVNRIESGQLSITTATREYGVSLSSIYKWLNKYSRNLRSGTRIVMEKDSIDKNISELQNRIKELEAALGRKTMESDLYKIIVDLASKEYKTDLKKNFGNVPSTSIKAKK